MARPRRGCGHLLGIITGDDVMDVLRAETTEDFHRMAAVGAVVGITIYFATAVAILGL